MLWLWSALSLYATDVSETLPKTSLPLENTGQESNMELQLPLFYDRHTPLQNRHWKKRTEMCIWRQVVWKRAPLSTGRKRLMKRSWSICKCVIRLIMHGTKYALSRQYKRCGHRTGSWRLAGAYLGYACRFLRPVDRWWTESPDHR